MSTSKSKFIETGLTFDDVLLVPAYSEVLPSQVNLHSKFSRNLNLKVPIVSAGFEFVGKIFTKSVLIRNQKNIMK